MKFPKIIKSTKTAPRSMEGAAGNLTSIEGAPSVATVGGKLTNIKGAPSVEMLTQKYMRESNNSKNIEQGADFNNEPPAQNQEADSIGW